MPLFSVAISPLFHAQPALDINRLAAAQVLRCGLSLPSPQRDAKPRSDIVVLSSLGITATLVRGQAEVANGRSVGRVAQFGITAQITNQNDLVERHFRPPLVCVLKGSQESYNERAILLGAARCVKRATEVFAAFGFDRNDATKSDRLWLLLQAT